MIGFFVNEITSYFICCYRTTIWAISAKDLQLFLAFNVAGYMKQRRAGVSSLIFL